MKTFDFDLKDKKTGNIADRIINNVLWNSSSISNIHVETEDDGKKLLKAIFDFE